MGDWNWTPAAAFFVGVGVASLAAAFLAILAKIAIADHRRKHGDDAFDRMSADPLPDRGIRSVDQRLRGIEERLATIERLQRQQLDAVHDTLPAG